jgi:hypothetical protein
MIKWKDGMVDRTIAMRSDPECEELADALDEAVKALREIDKMYVLNGEADKALRRIGAID